MRTNGLRRWPRRAYAEEVVQSRFLGRSIHLFNAPEAIRHILIDRHENYGRTPATLRILRPLLGEGLFVAEGRSWRHQRRTLAPAFTPRSVELLVPHVRTATRELIGALNEQHERPVDLLSAIQNLALEIAGRTMFSLEMGRHGPTLREFVMRYGRSLGRPFLLDFLLPIGLPTPQDLARAWYRRRWIRFMDRILAERLKAKAYEGPPRDLLDLLTAARDPDTGERFSSAQLRDQVATMIIAGHETTAVALFWSFYLLALSPEAQDRVAEEADRAIATGDLEIAASQLTFARAVLDEAMRLYPPAYVIVRSVHHADTVGGVQVRAGDLAMISPWVLHRHRRRWQKPDAFIPERFLPGSPAIDRFAYLPFGAGPRVCIGAHLALTEATLVLAEIARAFRIELAASRPVLPVAVVTTQPDHAPMFRLQKR